MTGEFRMTMDPSEKDALLMVPNAGLTLMEQMGMADKTDRFNRTDGTRLGVSPVGQTMRMNQFERLQQFALLQKPPAVKFKDLEASVNSTIKFNILPVQVRADYFPLTESSVLTTVTVQLENKDLQFAAKDGLQKAIVNLYGRITSMTRRPVNVFEDTVTVEALPEYMAEQAKKSSIYQTKVPLQPGKYRLNIVVKDVTGGNMNNYELALNVPYQDPEKLASSSLVLADVLEKVPTKSIGTGQFVIASSKVRPRINNTFRRDEKMGIYLKLYNFGADEKNKPNGTIEYEILKKGTNEYAFQPFTEQVSDIPGASGSQVTIEKLLPLSRINLEPGQYMLRMKITDHIKNETLTPEVAFTVI
jgi:hypothetical protein